MRTFEEVQQSIMSAIDVRQEEVLSACEYIWKNPESGYREVKTSRYLVEKLESLGLQVRTGLALTGFRADIDTGKPGPTLAILGELDSLVIPTHPECDPATGAVHACGHCCSAAALIGVAIGLLDAKAKGELCGKVALIGTPAEEGIELDYRQSLIKAGKIKSIAGKAQLIREGVFDDVDMAFMSHLALKTYHARDNNGCVNKKVTFHGKGCHAASPQRGINALNAVSLALHAIGLMREAYSNDSTTRIHGIVSNGGQVVNVIPNETSLEYMLRAPDLESILALNKRFDHVVTHAGLAAECSVEIDTVAGYMPLHNDDELGKVLFDVVKTAKDGAVFQFKDGFTCACTDMGDVSMVVPAVHSHVPGAMGTEHGVDYRVADPYTGAVVNAKISSLLAAKLLYGDAEEGKRIASRKASLMPIPEYIRTIDGISTRTLIEK